MEPMSRRERVLRKALRGIGKSTRRRRRRILSGLAGPDFIEVTIPPFVLDTSGPQGPEVVERRRVTGPMGAPS